MSELKLNPKLTQPDFREFREAIQHDKPFQSSDNDLSYLTDPFSVGYIKNFITMPEGFYDKILSHVKAMKLSDKSNDLYKFQQSKDFKFLKKSKILQEIRTFFLMNILPLMKEITGIDLFDNEIDITFSIYRDTDYLLCHDDHLEARRIAFVWYLVGEHWSEDNGGHLDLISCDKDGEPLKIDKSFLPNHNSFVFFKVADNSYHQVREIKAVDKLVENSRLSINGWFRGPSLTFRDVPTIPAPERLSPVHIEEALFYKWVNNIYISDEITRDIRRRFIDESEIQLGDFFNVDQFGELVKCLDELDGFQLIGPMNVRQIYLCGEDKWPDLVKEVSRVLRSEAMMVLLSDFTNLSLHGNSQHHDSDDEYDGESTVDCAHSDSKKPKLDPQNDSISVGKSSNVELRQWKSGCYSLLRDKDKRFKETRLEMFFSIGFPSNEVNEDGLNYGGYYSYFAEDEDEELLTVIPSDNSLSLVYADDQTMGFMKYITHRHDELRNESSQRKLYDFHATYYEYE